MSFLFSFPNFFDKITPNKTIQVDVKKYTYYDIEARDDSLIFYKCSDSKNHYEIIIQKENQPIAFRIYRSSNYQESQIYFLTLKDKLPILMKIYPDLNCSSIEKLCEYINKNPSQNLAHISAHFGYMNYFEQLSNECEKLINNKEANGKTPLHIAIESQHLNIIQKILDLSNESLCYMDNQNNNVLHLSASTNESIISLLCNTIKNKDDGSKILFELINTRNSNNFTPLYLACFHDKPGCVKELLKNGADVNGASISDYNENNQDVSNNLSDHSLIKMLNVQDMKNGGTPLHWCIGSEVIEILIDMNCNLNAKDFNGDSALHKMIKKGDLNCTLTLLTHGADVNVFGSNGNTPLHVAISTDNKILVKALLVFGADINALNSNGDSPRHLAATLNISSKDSILYILHSFNALRCVTKRPNCSAGCSLESSYNGEPPENFHENIPLFYDKVLLESTLKNNLEKKITENQSEKKIKLLCLDGGGIRGLILIQILCYLEHITNKRIVDIFDWIAGTSTGGIIALLLSSGYSAIECRNIYFFLKNKLFISRRPYCSKTLEDFLQKYLGSETRMNEVIKPKLMITATLADRFPPSLQLFRNYYSSEEILNIVNSHDNELNTNEYLWKVARATAAAPTYFSQFDCYLDGALISNNPTLDLLTEIQSLNCANLKLGNKENVYDIQLVVSLGTGIIPTQPMNKVNFNPLFSLSVISNVTSNFPNLLKILIEQATQANGSVVDRAQAWCSMIDVPYFRINPPISESIVIDEVDNEKLINMLWETMVYIYMNQYDISTLLDFFY